MMAATTAPRTTGTQGDTGDTGDTGHANSRAAYPNKAARRAAKRARLLSMQQGGVPLSSADKRYLALLDASERKRQAQEALDKRNHQRREQRRQTVDSIDRLNMSRQATDGDYVGQTVERDYDEDGSPLLYGPGGLPRLKASFEAHIGQTVDGRAFGAALAWLRSEYPRHYEALLLHGEHDIPLKAVARRMQVSLATAYNYVGHGRALLNAYRQGQRQERARRRAVDE